MARKTLSTDFSALKTKVKAEMLRRCYSGSVALYGGANYDYATPPAADGPILGEHLKKNLIPMQAINPDGLPVYPGPLSEADQEMMETKVAAWATRALTDQSATDCKTGCTGTCYTTCQTGCSGGCTGSCTGDCDGGCRGCGSGCSGGCSGCGSGCADTCSGCDDTCTGTCVSACGNTCGTGCTHACSRTEEL